ncbi:AP-1 adaptor complex mu subunit Apm1 [Schizosaccharomyces japonicus yFS275]|uniref:AP-1 adaptor complex mu subunit Apm1 n=1 Tax=Schizosaccharomyces japonicus (strain yFS275 / FY16936) TaxID=402676 RepID=B6K7A0_SCHJY|nr:AP-1 adaptor complex mu subunit Apm1 [Schizosaccharomyces japonicus yFS275]EEB09404.1 AP-1 adaptor complex mu subunit Apm1 [Schizosaccharomyces japonicus yFS275]
MASAVFILNLGGKTIISRNYRADIPMSAVEKFMPLLSEAEDEHGCAIPCMTHEGINYIFIQHNDVFLLALSKKNTNAMEILVFLRKLAELFTDYFKELQEESIRDNFVVVYELLDEVMDFGFPQTTETKILQEYITQSSNKVETQAPPPLAMTNAISWRSAGIHYRKNEVFLDVIESLNMIINAEGNVIQSEIMGLIHMKCYLSGMPELRLGLNDRMLFKAAGRTIKGKSVEMEDVKFHQCVRLSRFENDRTISFIPPDGEFDLMSYRLTSNVRPLIAVECNTKLHAGSRIEFMIKARAQFKKKSIANSVQIIVPVPEDADTPRFQTTTGTTKYAPEQAALLWNIKKFAGGKEYYMKAEMGLPSVRNEESTLSSKRPIQVKFSIPYFTVSGIQVRYLKITEPKLNYKAMPWVRYTTQNGTEYSIRQL